MAFLASFSGFHISSLPDFISLLPIRKDVYREQIEFSWANYNSVIGLEGELTPLRSAPLYHLMTFKVNSIRSVCAAVLERRIANVYNFIFAVEAPSGRLRVMGADVDVMTLGTRESCSQHQR